MLLLILGLHGTLDRVVCWTQMVCTCGVHGCHWLLIVAVRLLSCRRLEGFRCGTVCRRSCTGTPAFNEFWYII